VNNPGVLEVHGFFDEERTARGVAQADVVVSDEIHITKNSRSVL